MVVMNQELYALLGKCADSTGLPVMDETQFTDVTERYGKDVFRKTLAEYIFQERPPFPANQVTEKRRDDAWWKLKQYDIWKGVTHINNQQREVIEKFDDYKYPFSEHGLGVIDAPARPYNDVSDWFMKPLRWQCNSYSFKAPLTVWNEGTAHEIWACLGAIWRGINDVKKVTVRDLDGNEKDKLVGGVLQQNSYVATFRLATYIATQFKPSMAKTIYQMTNAKRVLDTSMGWGDRLTGFYASDAEVYIGCDPNPNTFDMYHDMIPYLEKMSGKQKTVHMFNCGAEDLPWDRITDIDCAFTSPPYFATERYNEGGKNENAQSWKKFSEYEQWRDDFFLPVSQRTFDSLSNDGHMIVNIMNPKVKNVVYPSCDELVDLLRPHFKGQIGMRIMQRPQGKSVFKDEEGNFDKEQLQDYFDQLYIENCWYFGKEDTPDIFLRAEKNNLDDFFA